jgi:hypothetical protein
MIASKSLTRRNLVFHDLDDAVRDAELLLERGYDRAGNWTLAQCCWHLSEWMRFFLDGVPRPPAPIRFLLWILKRITGKQRLQRFLTRGLPVGKPTLRESVLDTAGDDAQVVARFREIVARYKSHAGPLHPSPLFGDLDRETAMKLQLVHCSHHLSFLIPR